MRKTLSALILVAATLSAGVAPAVAESNDVHVMYWQKRGSYSVKSSCDKARNNLIGLGYPPSWVKCVYENPWWVCYLWVK
ncbi:hypothetical protein Lesp02_62110 [Lentzea sp. NBRC 105346]|nr:hypothetical protein Lesp02_62110 [Lentzea sp. NBRC 105346]